MSALGLLGMLWALGLLLSALPLLCALLLLGLLACWARGAPRGSFLNRELFLFEQTAYVPTCQASPGSDLN